MSYEEKGSWVYLVTVTGACAVYIALILSRAGGAPLSDVAYRSPMLWTMGIGILVTMAGRIAVEVVRPSDTHRADVRDKEIGRFGEFVGGSVLAVGMVVPFALTLLAADHFWIANAMYVTFVLATVTGAAARVVAYRRGLQAWANRPG